MNMIGQSSMTRGSQRTGATPHEHASCLDALRVLFLGGLVTAGVTLAACGSHHTNTTTSDAGQGDGTATSDGSTVDGAPHMVDNDHDGYGANLGDCDDDNPDVHPGATEVCGDNVDNNCNGITDSDCYNPCEVHEGDEDGVVPCTKKAPPDSFEPDIQWTWSGHDAEIYSIVTPLVANMTDDDENGTIDLCDTPDVLVVASQASGTMHTPGHVYLLDGATGEMELQFPTAVDHTVTPAIGDIDGDGLPEVVTADTAGHILAFEHDGTLKWTSTATWSEAYSGAIALADMDEDGDVEIIAGNMLFDHDGTLLWTASEPAGSWSATTAADLDGDGQMEMVLGHAAFHADGSVAYVNSEVDPGYPQVADMNNDGQPEILVTNRNGISLLAHDGTTIYKNMRPTNAAVGYTTWIRPATIHDFDGDGQPEFAVSSASSYAVYKADASIVWQAPVSDQSGIAAGTAFDFLGDGTAEAMYADEHHMFIFDGTGQVLLQIDRTSGTLSEYPVVADIDNDGSAEIVVVSCQYPNEPASPTVQVVRDKEDRWIQARRIWNEHTYHVTNVREDATIPQHEKPSWKALNTFRTNAQLENGGTCNPVVQ